MFPFQSLKHACEQLDKLMASGVGIEGCNFPNDLPDTVGSRSPYRTILKPPRSTEILLECLEERYDVMRLPPRERAPRKSISSRQLLYHLQQHPFPNGHERDTEIRDKFLAIKDAVRESSTSNKIEAYHVIFEALGRVENTRQEHGTTTSGILVDRSNANHQDNGSISSTQRSTLTHNTVDGANNREVDGSLSHGAREPVQPHQQPYAPKKARIQQEVLHHQQEPQSTLNDPLASAKFHEVYESDMELEEYSIQDSLSFHESERTPPTETSRSPASFEQRETCQEYLTKHSGHEQVPILAAMLIGLDISNDPLCDEWIQGHVGYEVLVREARRRSLEWMEGSALPTDEALIRRLRANGVLDHHEREFVLTEFGKLMLKLDKGVAGTNQKDEDDDDHNHEDDGGGQGGDRDGSGDDGDPGDDDNDDDGGGGGGYDPFSKDGFGDGGGADQDCSLPSFEYSDIGVDDMQYRMGHERDLVRMTQALDLNDNPNDAYSGRHDADSRKGMMANPSSIPDEASVSPEDESFQGENSGPGHSDRKWSKNPSRKKMTPNTKEEIEQGRIQRYDDDTATTVSLSTTGQIRHAFDDDTATTSSLSTEQSRAPRFDDDTTTTSSSTPNSLPAVPENKTTIHTKTYDDRNMKYSRPRNLLQRGHHRGSFAAAITEDIQKPDVLPPSSDDNDSPPDARQHKQSLGGPSDDVPVQPSMRGAPLRRWSTDKLGTSAPPVTTSTATTTTSSASHCYLVEDKPITDLYGEVGVYTGSLNCHTERPHGYGSMRYISKGNVCSYEGIWQEGHWQGRGKLTYTNGDVYDGDFASDMRHGEGTFQKKNGTLYVGSFRKDKRHGHGLMTTADGSTYRGEFVNSVQEGVGRADFMEGGYYEGEWKNSMFWGQGVCRWSNGRTYTGEFVRNQSHGQGIEFHPDGSIRHEGLWENNKPVRGKTPND